MTGVSDDRDVILKRHMDVPERPQSSVPAFPAVGLTAAKLFNPVLTDTAWA